MGSFDLNSQMTNEIAAATERMVTQVMKDEANQWCDENPSLCERSHWEGIDGHGDHAAAAGDDDDGDDQ